MSKAKFLLKEEAVSDDLETKIGGLKIMYTFGMLHI